MLGRKERLGGCFGLGSILLQVRQLEFELFEDRPPLRGLAEPLVPQLGDRVLEPLDQQRAELCRALAEQQRLPARWEQAPARIRKRAIDRPI